MDELPSGTVTFLFTDIESSTKLWEQFPEAMRTALAKHDAILRQAIESNHGHIVKTTGDGVLAVFENAVNGLSATLAAQQALNSHAWEKFKPGSVRVRMGLHSGTAELRSGDYFGNTLNRAARLMSVAMGGQILISNTTAGLVQEGLPANATLLDLGEHRLKDLLRPEHIYQLVHPSLPSEFPPIRSLGAFPNNLPVQLTSFIGREKEIADIKGLLNTNRLVTLTGSGGTGKTRLSQEVGAQEITTFPQGVWLIELAPLSDPAQIIPAMAQVFGLQEIPFAPLSAQVMDYLRDKKALVILDNCEHLIEACARLANDLLHQCASLKLLASSREALGIAGEVAYHTPSLSVSESTQLFLERACAANSNFNMTDSNAAAIAQICSRLDGIPFAIELAAARVRLLSPEQIAMRLDDRFRLLIGGSRTALPRQQTLRALIDWSYDLLSDEEKRLLQFASVFVGGWTLDALEAIADEPSAVEHLEQLVNKSLVVTEEHESEMRYFMLETVRQYAREKLFDAQQAPGARDRHFAYYNALSEKMWEAFREENLQYIINRATDEVENFRAAQEWGLENHVEENVRLAANYCEVASLLGNLAEGVAIAKTAVERAKTLPPGSRETDIHRKKLIARALFMQGMVGLGVGNMPLVLQVLREGIATSRVTGDKQMLGYCLEMYYTASGYIHVPDREDAALEGFHIFSQEINDGFGLGMAYMNMARLAAEKGNASEKEMYFEKLRERISAAPGSFQVGMFYLSMGMDENERGNFAAAKQLFVEGVQIFKGLGSVNFQLVLRSEIGHAERRLGNLAQAKSIYQDTIRDWQLVGNRSAIAHQLECFGFLAISDEAPRRALKLFAAAEALRERIDSPRTDQEQIEYDRSAANLHSQLNETEFNLIHAEGRLMTMEAAVAFALEQPHE